MQGAYSQEDQGLYYMRQPRLLVVSPKRQGHQMLLEADSIIKERGILLACGGRLLQHCLPLDADQNSSRVSTQRGLRQLEIASGSLSCRRDS